MLDSSVSESFVSYAYDDRSNRVSKNNGYGTQNYEYDDNNRMLTTDDGYDCYYYDNGNLSADGTYAYVYDGFNRLTEVRDFYNYNNILASYTYNGDGQRVSKTVDGVTTTYVWNGDYVVYEATGSSEQKYYYGTNLYAMEDTNGAVRYYGYNIHGDAVELYDSTGRTVYDYRYDAFGNQRTSNAGDTNPFRYCGEYYDSETGLIYLRNRYYNPATGRFITEDPIRDGLNWYVYCGNNPVCFVDPLGLENIVVAGGAYHQSNGEYQYEFVDSALLQIANINGDATLLVANAGWEDAQYDAIVKAATDRGINLLWFSTIDSLTSYINTGNDRANNKITSFYVFAHGTDSGTGNYAITFGLYSDIDTQLRWYTDSISKINPTAFADNSTSKFYSCRTGNDFENGNFARKWAWITGSPTYAYSGSNGRSDYSDILGTKWERTVKGKLWKKWNKSRGDITKNPGEAFHLPKASNFSSMKRFAPMEIRPAA